MTRYELELSIRLNQNSIKRWRGLLSLSDRPLNIDKHEKIKECETMLDMLELEEISLSKMLFNKDVA